MLDKEVFTSSKLRILISVIDDDVGETLSLFKSEEFKGLDAFELKRLLENICNSIISKYKRDLERAEKDVRVSLQRIMRAFPLLMKNAQISTVTNEPKKIPDNQPPIS
jgi:hypothetical protein